MNSTKIITFGYLTQFRRIHVKVTDSFFNKIKNKIIDKYGSLRRYNSFLKINYGTLKWEFRQNIYHPFYRIIKIIQDLNISKEELFNNIIGFYHWGSHDKNYLKIPKELDIDEFFVEGYALYLAEGTSGFSGKTRPRSFTFSNAELDVVNHMIKWFNRYFSELPSCIQVDIPINYKHPDLDVIKNNLDHSKIRFAKGYYNKILKYQLCCERAIVIDLILAIENKIKETCRKDKKLAAAYIRGMMIGEGTAYFNRSRYVRIEMKNEKEIKYLHQLFTFLGFNCKPSLRTERENMWSIYIGAKQLKKFYDEIGFGVHHKRQKILEKGVNKVLRVNQYC